MNTSIQPVKRRGGFPPGVSGNPAGRPRGRPDKRQRLLEALNPDLPEILASVVQKAKEGDTTAAALIMGRLFPPVRATYPLIRFAFDKSAPLSGQIEQVIEAMSQGKVAVDIGEKVLTSLHTLGEARALESLEQRVSALEGRHETD